VKRKILLSCIAILVMTLSACASKVDLTTIDLDDVRRTREASQILQCRQPTAYRNVVKKY
jgi:uncharacterized lipoprotein YmbA